MGHPILGLLILCSMMSRGFGNLSKNNSRELADIHIRQKRVIDKMPNGNEPVSIERFPYIVSIQKYGNHICGGSIIHHEIIITAAHCVENRATYSILSGSANVRRGIRHKIIKIINHPGYNSSRFVDDLALLIITPPIDFQHSVNRKIPLFQGRVPPNSIGTISGWGRNGIKWFGGINVYPDMLRSISVPIISLAECLSAYIYDPDITDKNICTLHGDKRKHCSYGDSGSPLVYDGKLLGVLSWNMESLRENLPDVFVNLANPEYKNWILSNLPHNLAIIEQHPHVPPNRPIHFRHYTIPVI